MSEGYVFGKAYKELRTELGENALRGELLSKHTTWGVGGPAGVFAVADNISHLRMIVRVAEEYDLPIFVIGKGSNLLVSDEGFQGIVVTLGSDFRRISIEGNRIRAGAAVAMPVVALHAYRAGFKSLAFAVGIPGSLGGAVCVNAGAHGTCLGDFISQVTVYTPQCELKTFDDHDISFGYRRSSVASEGIVVEVVLRLEKGKAIRTKVEMEKFFEKRKRTQPLDQPSAGSVFRNPPEVPAGKVIEEAGCKGLRVGQAQVSAKHANFIVNLGGATAREIYSLIHKVKQIVYERHGILLEPEITLLGDFENRDGDK